MKHPDAHPIARRLYVGSAPPPGDYSEQFDVIYLVGDYQPSETDFPNVVVKKRPFDDTMQPTRKDVRMMASIAEEMARDLASGKRVLSSCRMGRNRSALVAALALKNLFPCELSGLHAYELLHKRRVDRTGTRALANPTFARLLVNLDASLAKRGLPHAPHSSTR
jgi:hypothetical protein